MKPNKSLKEIVKHELDAFYKAPLCFVSRDEWGAQPARETEMERLTHPITKVHITNNSYTIFCKSKEVCIERVKEMQVQHMEKGSPDINHNFLIGEDDCVYEGRGWNFKPTVDPSEKRTDEEAIDIALIGDWRVRGLNGHIMSTMLRILRDGIKQNFLHKCYTYQNVIRKGQ